VASVSRIDKIVGLFYKRALEKRRYSAKETYNLIDPTDRSHPIGSGGLRRWRRSYRAAKTHRMPYLWRSFFAKEFYN